MSENKKQQSSDLERRDLLKGLATVPAVSYTHLTLPTICSV